MKGRARGPGLGLALIAISVVSLPAAGFAADDERAGTSTTGRRSQALRRRLSMGRQWPAGSIEDQLDRDATLIPYGKGAIFVPAMTSGLDEPTVEVLEGGSRVAEGPAGQRMLLPPGTYTVRIGSGASQQRMSAQATVKELSTTVVPVSWSGLTVHVVDVRYNSLRASYELIRADDREYIGIGFGTDEQAGEPISTWILRPGLYKIVRVGENYRARRDFVTVRLRRGRHTHFILVLNEETGEFAGGGEVPAKELFRPQDGVYASLIAGGDVTARLRDNALTQADGLAITAQAFVDGRFSVQLFENPLILQLQIEEGLTSVPDEPIQKTQDRLDLDGLYLYRIEPWIGPYGRVGVETNLFPGEEFLDPSGVVVRVDEDGNEIERLPSDRSASLSPPFGQTTVREGVGLNVRAFKSVFAEVNLRAGFGARHIITNELYERDGEPATIDDEVVYTFRQVRGNDRIGMETTVLATARLTRYVLINAEVDALITAPLEDSRIEAEGSVAFKLTSFLSLRTVFRYLRDATIAVERPDRIELDVLLRFSFDVL